MTCNDRLPFIPNFALVTRGGLLIRRRRPFRFGLTSSCSEPERPRVSSTITFEAHLSALATGSAASLFITPRIPIQRFNVTPPPVDRLALHCSQAVDHLNLPIGNSVDCSQSAGFVPCFEGGLAHFFDLNLTPLLRRAGWPPRKGKYRTRIGTLQIVLRLWLWL